MLKTEDCGTPKKMTSLDHIKAAFDLSDVSYTIREENGITCMFVGDNLEIEEWLDGRAVSEIPIAELKSCKLDLYEFYEDGSIASC